MKIILLGYMASGKSAIGNVLANVLDYQFIDLDDFIEDKEGCSISDFFDAKGEVYFRKKEHQYLKEVLSEKHNLVLSLGGGSPCYANNMDVIQSSEDTISFYLKASVIELTNRLEKEKEHRPLVKQLKNKEELTEFIAKHLFERNLFYSQADYEILVDDKAIIDIAKEIVLKLYQ